MKHTLLTFVSLALLTPVFAASVEDLSYERTSASTIAISDCNSNASGELVIPETINGKKVTAIGMDAFSFCKNLTSVTIPKSVTTIENNAFWGCESLTSVTIPEGVTTIGREAFWGCKLTSITIPEGVTTIGYCAFSRCPNLTSVTIPESVTTIDGGAFLECSAIEEIIFKGPPPQIGPLTYEDQKNFGRDGTKPETFPSAVAYYLPQHAKAWEDVLFGATGEWNNLQMRLIPEETKQSTSSSSLILWVSLAILGGVIIGAGVAIFFIFKKKKTA